MDGPPTAGNDHGDPSGAAPQQQRAANGHHSATVAYLFADVRGYTSFTTRRGAEDAALLASTFTGLAEDVVNSSGGAVTDTWGDEVLAEFASVRQAVRAAVDLQDRCIAATLSRPDLPLAVGIGLDAGEPAHAGAAGTVSGARSGSALNVASRLCDAAGPGEVLATREVTHLSGVVDGVVFTSAGRLRLKGVPGRTAVVSIRSASRDKDTDRRFAHLLAAPGRRAQVRRRAVVAGLAVVAVLAGTTTWLVAHRSTAAVTIPAQSVGIIDAGSGKLLGTVAVGGAPDGIALTSTAAWVANTADDSVTRIDRSTHTTQTVPLPGNARPVVVVPQGPYVWVVESGLDQVQRISAATGKVEGTVPVGNSPTAAAASPGALWVTDEADATVTRIDTTGVGFPRRTFGVGASPDGIAYGDGWLWVSNRGDDSVDRVDPDHPDLTPFAIPVGAGPEGVAVTAEAVWVVDSLSQSVDRIDPRTGQSLQRLAVGDLPTSVAAAGGSVWVSASGGASVVRIDARTNVVSPPWYVGSSPQGLAVGGGALWVAGRAFAGQGHRGGTLTVADSAGQPYVFDPAVDVTARWMPLVYDGLVGLHRADGATGFEPVPDLAVSLPRPSLDGLEYRFILRRGIRYSDGTPVRAEDFRRALEREFTATTDGGPEEPYLYSHIVGYDACVKTPTHCSFEGGVVTDNAAGTVTFRLTTPDPDFVDKLTVPFVPPVPRGTLMTGLSNPLLGTGPYRVTDFHPDGRFVLRRNRFFHQWSSAAQPEGFPDVIRWSQYAENSAALAAVEDGTADYAFPNYEDLPGLHASFPDQLREGVPDVTQMVVLNAAVAPFNRALARQAVAVALTNDPAMADIFDGSPVCELVPGGLPGHTGGCAYGRGSIADARRFVVASGTLHQRVNVYSADGSVFPKAFRYVAQVLHEIGYDVVFRDWPVGTYGPHIGSYDERTWPVNVEGFQWQADFPGASQYYDPLLKCDEGIFRWFACDPHLDALAKLARDNQLRDPGAAQRLWKELYTRAGQRAVLIPTNNQTFGLALVSERVHNFVANPLIGPLIDQSWVH